MRRLLVPLACVLLIGGCGNDRQTVPELREVGVPEGEQRLEFEEAGVEFTAPLNWLVAEKRLPAVFTLQSGGAFVTGFAYEREEDLPQTDGELAEAEERLIDEVEERDRGFDLRSSRTREVAGAPAVELRGTQTISNRRLETRSVHVFEGEVEYVFEALAPEDSFELASGGVLRKLLATVELRGTIREERRERRDRDRER